MPKVCTGIWCKNTIVTVENTVGIRKKSSPLEAIPCTWVTLPRLMRL